MMLRMSLSMPMVMCECLAVSRKGIDADQSTRRVVYGRKPGVKP
jgi:hypothetical protein